MKLDFLLLADMANVDAVGKFNIIGEFNLVRASALPTPPINMAVVARVVADVPEGPKHRITIALVDQDGKELFRLPETEIGFMPPVPGATRNLRAQLVLGIGGIRFHAAGPYSFHLLVDGRSLGEQTLHVLLVPSATRPQP